jgi:hypothetical protein
MFTAAYIIQRSQPLAVTAALPLAAIAPLRVAALVCTLVAAAVVTSGTVGLVVIIAAPGKQRRHGQQRKGN